MNGKDHFFTAMLFGTVLYIIIGYLNLGKDFPNPFWPYLFGTLTGGGFPDWDIMFGIGKHRNPVSHSSILQIGITASYMFTPEYQGFVFFLIFFNIGAMSHLIIDTIPGSCPKEYETVGSRWGYRLDYIMHSKGKAPGNIHRVSDKHERKWLLGHAFILFILAFILYLKLQYAIDLNIPVNWL